MRIPQELGWVREDLDVNVDQNSNAPSIFQFVTVDEEYVTWDIMIERAQKVKSMYSIDHAQYLLKKQSEYIPDAWKGYNILFPATRFLTNTNQWVCPYIKFNNNKWILDYHWYLYDFHHKDRFIRDLKLTV